MRKDWKGWARGPWHPFSCLFTSGKIGSLPLPLLPAPGPAKRGFEEGAMEEAALGLLFGNVGLLDLITGSGSGFVSSVRRG